jgi:hypothetical protein
LRPVSTLRSASPSVTVAPAFLQLDLVAEADLEGDLHRLVLFVAQGDREQEEITGGDLQRQLDAEAEGQAGLHDLLDSAAGAGSDALGDGPEGGDRVREVEGDRGSAIFAGEHRGRPVDGLPEVGAGPGLVAAVGRGGEDADRHELGHGDLLFFGLGPGLVLGEVAPIHVRLGDPCLDLLPGRGAAGFFGHLGRGFGQLLLFTGLDDGLSRRWGRGLGRRRRQHLAFGLVHRGGRARRGRRSTSATTGSAVTFVVHDRAQGVGGPAGAGGGRDRRHEHLLPLEAAITFGAHQQIHRQGRLLLGEVEEEVGLLDLVRKFGLQIQAGQQVAGLVIGEGQDRVVHHGQRQLGRDRVALGVGGLHRQGHLLPGRIFGLVGGELHVQAVAPVAVDQALRQRLFVFVEDRHPRHALSFGQGFVGRLQVDHRRFVGRHVHVGFIEEPLPDHRHHHHLLGLAAADRHPQLGQTAVEIVVAAQGAARLQRHWQGVLFGDPGGPGDLGEVASAGVGDEFDPAQARVVGGEGGGHVAVVIDDLALDVGGFADRVFGFEVDPRRGAAQQLPAFGEKGEVELLDQDRDAPGDRLGDAAVFDHHREQAVAALHPLRQAEADDGAARLVGGGLSGGQGLTVQPDHRVQRVAGQGLTGGPLHLDGGGDLVAGAVGLLHELHLLLEPRRLVGADHHRPLGRDPVEAGGPDQVLTTLYAVGDLEVVAGGALLLLHVFLEDGGALGADQLVADGVVVGPGAQVFAAQVPGLDPDGLARAVEGFVDLDVDAAAGLALEVAADQRGQGAALGEVGEARAGPGGLFGGDRRLQLVLRGCVGVGVGGLGGDAVVASLIDGRLDAGTSGGRGQSQNRQGGGEPARHDGHGLANGGLGRKVYPGASSGE